MTNANEPPAKPSRSGKSLSLDLVRDWKLRLKATPMTLAFDVGANVGQTALELRRAFPDVTIHSFEPVNASFSALTGALKGDANTHCHQLALGVSAGVATMAAQGTSTANAFVAEGQKFAGPTEAVTVTSGAQFCLDHNIQKISLLKIDTEGFDIDVLVGFEVMLRAQAIDVVQVEVSMNPDNRKHIQFAHMNLHMERIGYRLFALYDQTLENRGVPVLRRANPVYLSHSAVLANTWG